MVGGRSCRKEPLRTAVLLVLRPLRCRRSFSSINIISVFWRRGRQPEGSIERQDYDKLRAGLAGGNLAARLYAKWLTAFLDGVERFFGDAGIGGPDFVSARLRIAENRRRCGRRPPSTAACCSH